MLNYGLFNFFKLLIRKKRRIEKDEQATEYLNKTERIVRV